MSVIEAGVPPAAAAQPGLSPDAVTVIGLIALIGFPIFASPFFTFQIGAYSLVLGTVALSVMILGGYGGMVSLAQMTVAGIAGYTIAILGHNGSNVMGLGWPWWLAAPVAILLGSTAAAAIGALAVRTAGIYTIMITLAIATAFFYFVRQNYALFNGFNGFHGVEPPTVFGVYWHDPVPFYYLALAVAGFFFAATVYAERSTFGLSLQAMRDNPRRMRAIGYDVPVHRVAAFFLAGVIASTAGVLMVWFNGQISPGSVSVSAAVDSLVITVVGGIKRPIGPFIGALLFALLQNFAVDLVDPDRFNTVIGLVFLVIVLVSPDGLLGLIDKARTVTLTDALRATSPRRPPP